MALSTNSIVHYTKNYDSLIKILENGFRVNYCYEKIEASGKGYFHSAFPMVSFCDIPLSQVKNHIVSYGSYGIGLKKEWAKSKKLNPVLYFDKDSELVSFIREEFDKLIEKRKKNQLTFSEVNYLINILSYSKNYEGKILKKEGDFEMYRFYNEREWRYVPNKRTLGKAKSFVPENEYHKDKDSFNNALNHIRLTFETHDVSYLIVKSESEIKQITRSIQDIFSDKCTSRQMEMLITRIITTDQILYDF